MSKTLSYFEKKEHFNNKRKELEAELNGIVNANEKIEEEIA